jgi:hypothetical protein
MVNKSTPSDVYPSAEPALTPTPTAALPERGNRHLGCAQGRDIAQDIVDQRSKPLS